jgi:putative heme-binding domain-containing protein
MVFVVLAIWAALGAAAAPATTQSAKPKTIEQYQAFAMTHAGDPARGRALFGDEQRLGCGRCHSIDGSSSKVGPDLRAAGDKFGRRELVESVLYPSASIAVGYSTTIVKPRGGEDEFVGVVKDAKDGVTLMLGDGRVVHVAAAEIARQRVSDVSLMPEGLQGSLTLGEFADLIEYLTTLKTADSIALHERGMPAVIEPLATPIGLRAIHAPEHRFEHPVWVGPVPGFANTFAVVEHESGRIWVLEPTGDAGTERKSVFLQTGKFQTGTRGLLGMVFHPQYASNRRYFIVKHRALEGGKFASFVYEGKAADDGMRDSGQPLKEVLRFDEVSNVHYGGSLAFGPDGMLYVGMGDSGPQQDPRGNGQNPGLLLGKIMRVDVDHAGSHGEAYSIPKDNPFVGRSGYRPEIWALGLREPWRFSFDPVSAELWVGDVGQDLYEEVDIVRRGENYGWNVYEGFAPFSNRYRREGETYVPPVFAYTRKYGASVTGGFVYRGDPKSSFYGVYIFGDYQNSRIFGLRAEDRTLGKVRLLMTSAPQHVVSFGRDERGELYMVGYEGTIYRIDLSGTKFQQATR